MMKKKITYIIAIFSILFLAIACNEDRVGEDDTGSIKGTVVASGSNTPIPNVRVRTQPISSTVFTDSLGKFLIENVPVGDYAVEARVDDYITDFEPTTVVANVAVNVVFELEVSTANNRAPSAPELLSPEENEVLESIEAVFAWDSTDPDDDPITYALELRNDQNTDVQLFEGITDTTFTYSPLLLGAQYFWQVSASDEINDPVLSPVGTFSVINAPVDNRFLFTRKINGNNVIFSADADGTEFQLTPSDKNSFRPTRNVAAGKIAFLQSNGAEVDIYTMDRDGSNVFQVTGDVKPAGFNLNEINFSWPKNSNRIYFPVFNKLYRVNTTGESLIEVLETTDGSFISEVDVNVTDRIMAVKTNDINGYNVSIFTADLGGNLKDVLISGVQGAISGLELSVTNEQVLYTYDVSGFESADYRRLDSRLFIYDIPSATAIEISGDKPNGTNDLQAKFSPNQAQVIFMNTSNDGISQQNIVIIDVDIDENMGTRTDFIMDGFMPDWE